MTATGPRNAIPSISRFFNSPLATFEGQSTLTAIGVKMVFNGLEGNARSGVCNQMVSL